MKQSEGGQGTVDYALVLLLVAVVINGAWGVLGLAIRNAWCELLANYGLIYLTLACVDYPFKLWEIITDVREIDLTLPLSFIS